MGIYTHQLWILSTYFFFPIVCVVDFFDRSQIFYLQKNPVPKRADVEGIVLELVQALARNEYVVIKE